MRFDLVLRCMMLVLTLSVLPVSAQESNKDCPPPLQVSSEQVEQLARSQQPDRGPLWELSKDGRRSYLYGTVHVAKLEWDIPGPVVRRALIASRVLLVELDVTQPEIGQQMIAPMPDQAVETDSAHYRALAWRVSKQFHKACLNEAGFGEASLSSKLNSLILLSARDAGLYPDLGIDLAITGFVKHFKKPVVALETVEEQRVLISRSTLNELEQNMKELESGEAKKNLERFTALWSAGSVAEMERFCAAKDCFGDASAALERNTWLAQRIAERMQSDDGVFAAIGFLHLVGPGNVLQQLRAKGFKVRQLTALSRR
ncbi:TraB/GumN family protein [Herbaspirillum sp. NPDC087042]|uniref:TraB/GumN family protein n=1 Tax=Herbaspirillum sp. NPDC087042 TaxID=3364004 RepID=UPI0038245DBF